MAEQLRVTTAEGQGVAVAAETLTAIAQRIQEEAARLFREDRVDVIIGYGRAWREDVVTPRFVTDAARVGELIFDEHCTNNLAKYLVGADGLLTSPLKTAKGKPRVAVVATPAALRAIAGLIQEHQFKREDVIVLGIVDGCAVGIEPDVIVGHVAEDQARQARIHQQLERLESMSVAERWAWWEEQFAKCIRCYACRQVCPFCYCEQCIADENQPQWIERSLTPMNNRIWNTIRAFHLVGRCVDCGECERVCPVDIPLSLLNCKMIDEVKETFGYVAGETTDAASALFSFRVDDPDDFIK